MIPETISHYRILQKLGAGGMGEVYLAEDLALGRKVALKLLPARYTADEERVRRFSQEARAASSLNHPNIITIYEVGLADDLHYIVTEFVEGQTLRARLRAQRFAVGEVLEVASQVAQALSAAHEAGLLHRDIKPENIMVRPDGYVKVLDFGLAKLTEPPSGIGPETEFETEIGIVLGTVPYMSPEQVRGLKLDPRSDLFSLGAVLYELIAGVSPFAGETRGDITAAILNRELIPLSRLTSKPIPFEFETIIARLLARDRARRYQSAKQLFEDLRALQRRGANTTGEAGAETAAHPVVGYETQPARARRPRRRKINSLAVLPFINESADSNAAYLSDGITERLINILSRLPRLRVMARSTVFRYQGQLGDPLAVGRQIGVRAVLMGRVLLLGDRVVVKAELVDTDDGAQLWGEQYARQLDDVYVIEEEISREISDKLRLRLTGEERRRLTQRQTESSEAYQAYLKGRFYWNQRTAQGLKRAIESFEQAIAIDPNYALAHAGLADSYCLLGIYAAVTPRAIMPRAKAAAERALALDETLPEAHTALAGARAFFDWDWPGAEREFVRAIQLDPASALARHWYASVYLTAMGRFAEAMEEEERARELDPFSLVINTHLGWIRYQSRRYEEAVNYYRQALELEPHFIPAQFYLGLALTQLGRHGEAQTTLSGAADLSRRGAMIVGALGYAHARAGDEAAARAVLDELARLSAERYVSPFYRALVRIGLGERDEAFAELSQACEERFCWLVWLRTEPMYDVLRADARFDDLLRRTNLTD